MADDRTRNLGASLGNAHVGGYTSFMAIVISQLSSGHQTQFDRVYEIYRDSIEASEQKSRVELLGMLERTDYAFFIALDSNSSDDVVLGFSILFVPPWDTMALLEYMAVVSSHRNAGVGAELFRDSTAAVLRVNSGPVILEVDSDRGMGEESRLQAARIRFYQRLGCRRIKGLKYLLPLQSGRNPPDMEIFLYFGMNEPPSEVGLAKVKHWLTLIYEHVYHMDADDPRIQLMTQGLQDPVSLK